MDEAAFEKKMNELVEEIKGLPDPQRKELITLVRNTGKTHNKLRKSMDQLQESLDYLRVCVKYLLFDLDATRRENEGLKKLLKDQHGS
ncbi:MAG TPA: hypothetical protein ENH94_10180 [Phycisphaerales bacterium]|nr:hypothetical protein [Phycisphaerales bacterium]